MFARIYINTKWHFILFNVDSSHKYSFTQSFHFHNHTCHNFFSMEIYFFGGKRPYGPAGNYMVRKSSQSQSASIFNVLEYDVLL